MTFIMLIFKKNPPDDQMEMDKSKGYEEGEKMRRMVMRLLLYFSWYMLRNWDRIVQKEARLARIWQWNDR